MKITFLKARPRKTKKLMLSKLYRYHRYQTSESKPSGGMCYNYHMETEMKF